MHLAAHLAEIDRLLAHPGPQTVELRTSEAFWEDDGTARPAAEREFEADREALATLLSERWGEPATLDLTAHLLRLLDGGLVPEPLDAVCGQVRRLQLWRPGPDGRWLGLGIGVQGQEQPIQLVACAGDGPAPPAPPAPPQAPPAPPVRPDS